MAKRKRFSSAETRGHRVFYHTSVSPETPHSALGYPTPLEFERNTRLNFTDFWSKLTLALQ